MTDLDRALTDVFSELADDAPHDPGLARRVRQRARVRGTARLVAVAAACAVLVAGAAVVERGRSGSGSTVGTTPAPACEGTPRSEVVPDWARAGFSDPRPVAPLVHSRSGNVVAILFGGHLYSPPRRGLSNKVLWVWRQVPGGGTGDVTMTAQLAGTDKLVTTGLPRPEGPSTVDLPLPGCWRITLHSAAGTDTIDLDYGRP